MSRLPRKHIPLDVRYRVVLRQLGLSAAAIDAEVDDAKDPTRAPCYRGIGRRLGPSFERLALSLGCEVSALHLDHDPALANREKTVLLPNGDHARVIIVPKGARVLRYRPDELDPDHLIYRVGGAGSEHDVKTRVRGEHGQHSDLALLRKNKRIEAKRAAEKKPKRGGRKTRSKFPKGRKIQSRPFPKAGRPFRRKR